MKKKTKRTQSPAWMAQSAVVAARMARAAATLQPPAVYELVPAGLFKFCRLHVLKPAHIRFAIPHLPTQS